MLNSWLQHQLQGLENQAFELMNLGGLVCQAWLGLWVWVGLVLAKVWKGQHETGHLTLRSEVGLVFWFISWGTALSCSRLEVTLSFLSQGGFSALFYSFFSALLVQGEQSIC